MKKLIILIFSLLLSGECIAAEKVLREGSGCEIREGGGFVVREESVSISDGNLIHRLLAVILGE
jgi:F420-0:gamma-glutamyl ligase-like protein